MENLRGILLILKYKEKTMKVRYDVYYNEELDNCLLREHKSSNNSYIKVWCHFNNRFFTYRWTTYEYRETEVVYH